MAFVSTSRIRQLQKDYEELSGALRGEGFDSPQAALSFLRDERGFKDIALDSHDSQGRCFTIDYDGALWFCESWNSDDEDGRRRYELGTTVELEDDEMRCPFDWDVFSVDCD